MNAEPVVKMVRTSAFATCVCVSVCVGTIAVLAEAQQSEMPRAVSALNWLDQSGEYFHSPVLAALFREQRVRLHAPEYIREFGGLLVPAGFESRSHAGAGAPRNRMRPDVGVFSRGDSGCWSILNSGPAGPALIVGRAATFGAGIART